MQLIGIDQAGMSPTISPCDERVITEAYVHSACSLSYRETSRRGKTPAWPTLRFGRGTELETVSKDLSLTGEKWSSQNSKIDADRKHKKALHVSDITRAQVYPALLRLSHTPPSYLLPLC